MFGNAAQIYGPYMYPSSDSPRYIPGGTANTVICLATAAVAGILRWIHTRENKRLGQADEVEEDRSEPGFRYIL